MPDLGLVNKCVVNIQSAVVITINYKIIAIGKTRLGAKAKLADAVRILDGLMASGPWAAGGFSLADCTLLPRVVLMQKTVVLALGVPDLASAGPNLAAWWRKVNDDPLTAPFVPEYGGAVEAFLARLRGG